MSFNMYVKLTITTLFLFAFSFNSVIAQDDFSDGVTGETETLTISGVVKDASGQPIAGANVIVKDTDLGSATDEDGNFTIEDVSPGSELTAL